MHEIDLEIELDCFENGIDITCYCPCDGCIDIDIGAEIQRCPKCGKHFKLMTFLEEVD